MKFPATPLILLTSYFVLARHRLGNYLVVLFLVSKVFYIGNAVGQLFLLNVVLATKYYTLGFDVTSKLARQQDWTEESYVAFPRVTLCDFKVHSFVIFFLVCGLRYWLQCVLETTHQGQQSDVCDYLVYILGERCQHWRHKCKKTAS